MQDTDPTPATSQDASLADWLRLQQAPGVGPVTVQRLLARFSSPQAIFNAGSDGLGELVPAAVARALCAPPDAALAERIAQVHAWLDTPGNRVLTLADPAYPALLRHIPDPPVLLYAIGRCELLAGPALAIVGSRNASTQGKLHAQAFGQALSEAGLSIVSGLALGIDAAAHEGGLRGAGSTIAVVGTGADRIYPRANRALAHRIAEQGCILSEYPLGTPPLSENFPKRNRLISGLSCAVLVVEAAAASGSLITAHGAIDQGRDVFAIPGSIHAPLSKGCHRLIKEGARLVESSDDILLELAHAPLVKAALPAAEPSPEPGNPELHALLQAIGYEPVQMDMLALRTAINPGPLSARLLELELAGLVERLPGGFIQRLNR